MGWKDDRAAVAWMLSFTFACGLAVGLYTGLAFPCGHDKIIIIEEEE